jgi:hypothetical protein
MWKKIRYVLYFTVLITVFAVTYSVREYYYVPVIQKYLNKATGSKVKFRNFSISLPFELSVRDIEFDKKLSIDTATLRFDPLMFFKNINKPVKSLVAVTVKQSGIY